MTKLPKQVATWSEYVEFCHNVFVASVDTDIGKAAFEESGVLSYWVTETIKIAESVTEVPLNDRVSSLVFVCQIWIMKCDFISKNFHELVLQLLNVLKRASRDIRQTLVIVSVELMFRLLEEFAGGRN